MVPLAGEAGAGSAAVSAPFCVICAPGIGRFAVSLAVPLRTIAVTRIKENIQTLHCC
jgi:hypothetical protein